MTESEPNPMNVSAVSDDVTGPERTLRQMFGIFVEPEIARRQKQGLAPNPLPLAKWQVLFPEGGAPEVRINDEVKISLIVRAPREIFAGEAIDLSEISEIEGTELYVPDADAGHFTAMLRSDAWLMSFDFRRNKAKAFGLVSRAEEFLQSAEHALNNKLYGPWIDNLFSASELLAKAHLITSAAESSDIKSHGTIKSGLNRWGKLGNVKSAFVETFNKLSRIRESARYGGGDLSDLVEPEMLTIVRSELETLTPRLKRFSDDP